MSVVVNYDQIIKDTELRFVDELKDVVESDLNCYGDNEITAVHVEKCRFYKVVVKTKYTIIIALYRYIGPSAGIFIDIEKIKLSRYNMIRRFQESGMI